MIRRQKPRYRPRRKATECYFCKEKIEPSFLEVEVLEKCTSDKGKILSRDKSGNCQKHQRRATIAIKRARHLALLPFLSK